LRAFHAQVAMLGNGTTIEVTNDMVADRSADATGYGRRRHIQTGGARTRAFFEFMPIRAIPEQEGASIAG